ncbi:MAG: hypothetical protein R3185_03465, partial [Candidatus Thermoplasmatota archaeon]|nr:hypothetical protein [Candidatus Thermoplasmatota archaeon]
MRELVVSKAPLPRMATITKEVVQETGGVVAEHTHQVTRFDHLRTSDDNWSRSGYIGTYQPFQQDKVRVRIRVWASWPRKLLRFFIYLGLAEAVLFFLMSFAGVPPAPNVWILTAILTFAAIGLSLLTYSTSWASSQEIEDTLARRIGSQARADPEVPGDIFTEGTWEEHKAELIDEAKRRAKQAPETLEVEGGVLAKVDPSERQLKARREKVSPAKRLAKKLPTPTRSGSDGEAEPEDDEDETPEGDQRGLKARIPFLKTKDEEDEDEAGAADEPADDA